MLLRKYVNKRVFIFLCFVLILSQGAPILAGNTPIKDGIDIVLVIDTSGSMRGSDRSRNAIEATKMFIDMMELKKSRVAVIGFTDVITGIVEMTEINTPKDKEDIKKTIDQITYDGFTDIGISLQAAVSMILDKTKDKNSPMVLLLTDGNIEIDPDKTEREEQDSYDDIMEAITLAGKKIPIYTIGLNSNNNVEKELLENISQITNGRNYIINEADMLPQIFNEIFADHIKSALFEVDLFMADGENYTDVAIEIDSDFVAEANIIMLSENEVADVKLFDPDGSEITFEQDVISLSKSKKYSMIKVIEPRKGEWHLKVKGIKDDRIRVNLIYQYDVTIEMSVTQQNMQDNKYNQENNISVTGVLTVNKEEADPALYNSTAASLVITDDLGEILDEIALSVSDGVYKEEYTPKSDETIKMYINIDGENFQKQSNVVEIVFEKTEPVLETPDPTAAPDPTVSPDQIKDNDKSVNVLVPILIIIVLILTTIFILFKRNNKKDKSVFFRGYILIRAMENSGKYMSLETPSLINYVKKINLHEFITDTMSQNKNKKILKQADYADMIYLYPGRYKNQDVLYIENNSDAVILDSDGNKKDGKRIMWKSNEMIIMKSKEDSFERLEMTYRGGVEV